MSLRSISNTKKKKTVIVRRPKTGLDAVPMNSSFNAIKFYFHYDLDKKDIIHCIKSYIKSTYTKEEAKIIGYNPEYKFSMFTHYGATAYLLENKYAFADDVYPQALKRYCDELLESGKELEASKLREETLNNSQSVVFISPQQRLANKVNDTIMVDIDELEDSWIVGEKPTLELYNLMQKHELKGMAVPLIRPRLEGWLLEYQDAYFKKCEQAVEGYSHLTRRELKRRIDDIERMLTDLDSFHSASKAKRATRVAKPKSADKQVAKVKYKKEDSGFKLASINPSRIIGAVRLYVFNTKYKQLTEYVSDVTKGFEVSGTTIKGFDPKQSRKITLRKPQDVLSVVLNKSPTQINKTLESLTTKPSEPNGRLNEETIILRVI
jgi:hypothetical protein